VISHAATSATGVPLLASHIMWSSIQLADRASHCAPYTTTPRICPR